MTQIISLSKGTIQALRDTFSFAGFAGRQRAHDDDRVPLSVRHQLRGDDEHAKVRAQHQEHPEPAGRQRGGGPKGPGHPRAPERDQDAEKQAEKLS